MNPTCYCSQSRQCFPWTVSAQTTAIPIFNPQFALDTLPCEPGEFCDVPGISGWIAGPGSGVLKGSTAQFTLAPPQGIQGAYVGGGTVMGSINADTRSQGSGKRDLHSNSDHWRA
jgi:hypothetical protein